MVQKHAYRGLILKGDPPDLPPTWGVSYTPQTPLKECPSVRDAVEIKNSPGGVRNSRLSHSPTIGAGFLTLVEFELTIRTIQSQTAWGDPIV